MSELAPGGLPGGIAWLREGRFKRVRWNPESRQPNYNPASSFLCGLFAWGLLHAYLNLPRKILGDTKHS